MSIELTDAERDILAAALASREKERELPRLIRQSRLAERHRRAQADRADHERFARGLLTSAGIDLADMERRRERNTAGARAFLEQQRGRIIDHSGVIAERHQALARSRAETLAAEHRSGASGTYQLDTLETAAAIWPVHANPDAHNHVSIRIEPPAPMHNAAKVFQSKQTSPDVRFHVPGSWIIDIHWVFTFPVADNVLLNAVTFVQASGADSLFASGWVLGDSYAQIDFRTRLDMFTVGPPPLQQVQPLGTGDNDEGRERHLHSDWWDLLGQFDSTVYDFQSTLIDKSFSHVAANSTVVIVVSATLDLTADGNAFCVADFFSGDLRINVPAVYVSTFPDNPIP